MGKNIRVEPTQLQSSAKKLLECSKTYRSIANDLMQNATTMQSAWEGEDNQVFTTQITGFTEELKSMADKLKLASETLEKEAKNYTERQNAIIDGAKKLRN